MPYVVSTEQTSPDLVAVATGVADADRVSQTMLGLIGNVWTFIKKSGVKTDGHNIAIYQCGEPRVSIQAGARVLSTFEGSDGVICSTMPAGTAATTAHIGPYTQLGAAHRAIVQWCKENGKSLTGVNWEVYDHWTEDDAKLRTDVYYLLA